jgi:hypothetical protein
MRQAIVTKYLGPTNFRGSRIKATSASGLSVTVSYRSELSADQNHLDAALTLCRKLNWLQGSLHMGGLETGYVFVFENPAFVFNPV